MSVSGRFWRLNHEDWLQLEPYRHPPTNPGKRADAEDAFLDILFDDRWPASGRYLDVDRAWHLLDYLLRVERESPPDLTPGAIWGGAEFPFEDSEGFVRYLIPAEVREVADRLERRSVGRLQASFDIQDLRRADIYPGFDRWEVDAVHGLIEQYFPPLVAFYREAARANQHVVLARL